MAANSITGSAYVGGGSPQFLGAAATDKVGFFGATAVVQQAAITAISTSSPTTAAYGFTTTQATAIITAINSLITTLQVYGITL